MLLGISVSSPSSNPSSNPRLLTRSLLRLHCLFILAYTWASIVFNSSLLLGYFTHLFLSFHQGHRNLIRLLGLAYILRLLLCHPFHSDVLRLLGLLNVVYI